MSEKEEKVEFEHHVDTSELHSYMPALVGLAAGAFVAAGVIFLLKGPPHSKNHIFGIPMAWGRMVFMG